jgi:fatty-acyl-CoA synthase
MGKHIPYEEKTFDQAFCDVLQERGDQEALIFQNNRYTVRDWNRRSKMVMDGLYNIGVRKGMRVAHFFPATDNWVFLITGTMRMGSIVVPLNLEWKAKEIRDGLKRCGVNTLIFTDWYKGRDNIALLKEALPGLEDCIPGNYDNPELPELKNLICISEIGETYSFAYDWKTLMAKSKQFDSQLINRLRDYVSHDDMAYFLMTSGTLSHPKPVMIDHLGISGFQACAPYAMWPYAKEAIWRLGLKAGTDPTPFLMCVPNWHNASVITLWFSFFTPNQPVVVMDLFDPELVLETLEKEKVVHTFMFTLHFKMLKSHPRYEDYHHERLKIAWIGSMPMDYELIAEMGIEVQGNIYGLSESGLVAVGLMTPDYSMDPNKVKWSHGKVVPWLEVEIRDPETNEKLPNESIGSIWIKGPYISRGYYNMPEENAKLFDDRGFLHTEDIGYIDEENCIKTLGKTKDMVKTGGENVAVREVEDAITEYVPEVNLVVVVGIPDEKWVEKVTAVVTLNEGFEGKFTAEDIQKRLKTSIAGYKVPKVILFVSEQDFIPHIRSLGKYNRPGIRQLAMRKLGIEDEQQMIKK